VYLTIHDINLCVSPLDSWRRACIH